MKPYNTKSFFITGTGTGVGKTMVTAALAALFIANERKVAVMKPVQTGLSEGPGDIETIGKLVPGLIHLPKNIACPYSFSLPASPALAASESGKKIYPQKILSAYSKCLSYPDLDVLLVEGAGGLMVPIATKFMMIDLISILKIPVILVADAGLGTINHTLLSVEAMRKRKIRISGIIINRMPTVPGKVEKNNIRTIESLSGIPVISILREMKFSEKTTDVSEYLSDVLSDRKSLLKLISPEKGIH